MARSKIVFESSESIYGVVPRANDWIEYKGVLKVKDSGKTPVLLDLTFVPPHPFIVNMPLTHSIKAESITAVYAKLVKFLKNLGIEFRN